MRIDIGETECESALKIKYSTEMLLGRLRDHHDYTVPFIPSCRQAIEIQTAPEEAMPIEICILPIARGKITVEGIKRVVCKYFNISHQDLVSPRRDVKVLRPRAIAIYLAKELTPHSLSELGRRFGRRDHTTILYSVRKLVGMIEAGHPVANDVSYLREVLEA